MASRPEITVDNSTPALARRSGHTKSRRDASELMAAIRDFAQRVALEFRPDRIILFGSHAYGTPHIDSDVDILVVMPTRNQHTQAVKIRRAVPREFAMDLIVRTPMDLAQRLANDDMFHTEIVTKGKVLYEAGDTGMGGESRRRLPRRGGIGRKPEASA